MKSLSQHDPRGLIVFLDSWVACQYSALEVVTDHDDDRLGADALGSRGVAQSVERLRDVGAGRGHARNLQHHHIHDLENIT